jgi:protein-S-isoprenylcysteine O-methyltransferase Ste14
VQDDHSGPRVFVPPPLLIVATLLSGLALDPGLRSWPVMSVISAVPAIIFGCTGFTLIGLALGLFARFQTRPEPWKPSSALVTTGVYRYTRNPMYVGMLLVYLAAALMFRSSAAGILSLPLFLLIDQFVVRKEEEYLSARFGAPYEDYRRIVRRWA